MPTHELKTWPDPFDAMWRGDKTAEFRKDDREPRFTVGDILHLREWNPTSGRYCGREIWARVTDVRAGGVFGIPEGYAMISVGSLERYTRSDLRRIGHSFVRPSVLRSPREQSRRRSE
jgi:hypothetical protein